VDDPPAGRVASGPPAGRSRVSDILDLERLGAGLFRGRSGWGSSTRVFGGEVAGQALMAAGRTVPDQRRVHSLHAYFLRPGDSSEPIDYQVDPIRDGGSFTTRRTVAPARHPSRFRADDWPFYQQEGAWAGGARALCRGSLFDRSGRLVASVMQEGLIRPRRDRAR
jgi:acyl-CoA thioesterase